MGQARGIQAVAEGETTGHHPDDTPVDLLKVTLVDDTRQGKHSKRNHSHRIGIDARHAVEQPEGYRDEEGDNDHISLETFLHTALDIQFDTFLGEGEHTEQNAPADEQQHDDQREHEHHPLTEAQSEVQALRVVEVFQGDSVRRRADRCTHTTEVGSHWDGHGQGDAALALGGQLTEHRGEEGQHHGSRRRVRHEHREQSRDEQEAQQHHLTLRTEGLQQHLGQLSIEPRLRGSDRQHETTDEQHDHRVGKSGHYPFIRQELTYFGLVHHRQDTAVCTEQEHQYDDGHGGSP